MREQTRKTREGAGSEREAFSKGKYGRKKVAKELGNEEEYKGKENKGLKSVPGE